ncbi:MAG: DUF5818 domain-containing protein [Thermoanaerobaculia bacterium]
MRRLSLATAIFAIVLLYGFPARARNRHATIAGYIGDSMCGLRHGHGRTTQEQDRDCTLQCVKDGSRFILADRAARKVYELDDQEAPRRFAGEKVQVTGEIDGNTVRVETIEKAR